MSKQARGWGSPFFVFFASRALMNFGSFARHAPCCTVCVLKSLQRSVLRTSFKTTCSSFLFFSFFQNSLLFPLSRRCSCSLFTLLHNTPAYCLVLGPRDSSPVGGLGRRREPQRFRHAGLLAIVRRDRGTGGQAQGREGDKLKVEKGALVPEREGERLPLPVACSFSSNT